MADFATLHMDFVETFWSFRMATQCHWSRHPPVCTQLRTVQRCYMQTVACNSSEAPRNRYSVLRHNCLLLPCSTILTSHTQELESLSHYSNRVVGCKVWKFVFDSRLEQEILFCLRASTTCQTTADGRYFSGGKVTGMWSRLCTAIKCQSSAATSASTLLEDFVTL